MVENPMVENPMVFPALIAVFVPKRYVLENPEEDLRFGTVYNKESCDAIFGVTRNILLVLAAI